MGTSRWYAGIGSRETPPHLLAWMTDLAAALADRGWGLRSGGAPGADAAFEAGARAAKGPLQVFLPWRGFGTTPDGLLAARQPAWARTDAIARQFHPAYEAMKPSVRALMRRNTMQVLGPDLAQPSRFVLMWAPRPRLDAHGWVADCAGGTGQAVRIAHAHGIPVFHLELHAERIQTLARAGAA